MNVVNTLTIKMNPELENYYFDLYDVCGKNSNELDEICKNYSFKFTKEFIERRKNKYCFEYYSKNLESKNNIKYLLMSILKKTINTLFLNDFNAIYQDEVIKKIKINGIDMEFDYIMCYVSDYFSMYRNVYSLIYICKNFETIDVPSNKLTYSDIMSISCKQNVSNYEIAMRLANAGYKFDIVEDHFIKHDAKQFERKIKQYVIESVDIDPHKLIKMTEDMIKYTDPFKKVSDFMKDKYDQYCQNSKIIKLRLYELQEFNISLMIMIIANKRTDYFKIILVD